MKKFITLLLLLLATFSINSQAQSTLTCNADFNFQFVTATSVKFTPVVVGDSFNTSHYWRFGDGSVINIP